MVVALLVEGSELLPVETLVDTLVQGNIESNNID
jgi:hypothetical protein